MKSAPGLLVAVCLAGCYTNSRGERNLCIPGGDGLCPAPDLYHRFVPIQIVDPDEPVVLVHSFDDFSSVFEEIAGDARSHDVSFHEIDADERPVVACGITCVAVWRNAAEWTVLSSVRSSSGWSAPERHARTTSLPAVVSSGDLMLIAWLERETISSARVELRRLDPSGAVIDGATLATGVGADFLSLTAGVDGALVSWKRSQTAGSLYETFLVAQPLAVDGTPTAAPLEARLADGLGRYQTSPVPSAFVQGAYRVVDDQLPGDSTWAVIDPVARTIGFAMLGTAPWRKAILRILAVADGALVVLSNPATIARVANDAVVSAVDVSGGPPVIAATADGYQLAYLDEGFDLVVERRDSNLQLVDGPTVIAERYQVDNTTCAAGHHQDFGIVALICLVACRRRRRERSSYVVM